MLSAPTVAKVWNGIDCYAMDSNALDTNPILDPFQWIGMDTIGMDTYGFVAGVVVVAALNVLTQQDRMLTVVQSVWRKPVTDVKPVVGRQTTVESASLRTPVRRAIIIRVIAQRTELEKCPHRGDFLCAVCPVLGQLAEAWPHPADRHPHAGRRYNPAKAQQGTGADMGTPNTYGEWHEPVQVPSAAGAITEKDASMPGDRVKFERLADEWLEQRPRGVDVAQMIRHPAYQGIIDIGAEAVPWLLERLAQRPDHWFHALNQITDAQPVQPEHQGIVAAMAQDWITWGRQHQSQEQNVD